MPQFSVQEEPLTTWVYDALPMIQEHFEEVALNKKARPLDVDWDKLRKLNELGVLKFFVVRIENIIAGYFSFVIDFHPRYKTWKIALADVYYLLPKYRRSKGFVIGVFREIDEYLKRLGVRSIVQHDKVHRSHKKLFLRLGYKETEVHYEKVL